jgi:hypothetical protein
MGQSGGTPVDEVRDEQQQQQQQIDSDTAKYQAFVNRPLDRPGGALCQMHLNDENFHYGIIYRSINYNGQEIVMHTEYSEYANAPRSQQQLSMCQHCRQTCLSSVGYYVIISANYAICMECYVRDRRHAMINYCMLIKYMYQQHLRHPDGSTAAHDVMKHTMDLVNLSLFRLEERIVMRHDQEKCVTHFEPYSLQQLVTYGLYNHTMYSSSFCFIFSLLSKNDRVIERSLCWAGRTLYRRGMSDGRYARWFWNGQSWKSVMASIVNAMEDREVIEWTLKVTDVTPVISLCENRISINLDLFKYVSSRGNKKEDDNCNARPSKKIRLD